MSGRAVRVVLAFLKGSFLVMGYVGVDKHDGFHGWGRLSNLSVRVKDGRGGGYDDPTGRTRGNLTSTGDSPVLLVDRTVLIRRVKFGIGTWGLNLLFKKSDRILPY